MNKNIFICLLALAYCGQLLAAKNGEVVVLKSPLFEKPDLKSRIIHYVSKTDKVYLPESQLPVSPNEIDYLRGSGQYNFVFDDRESEAFYKTITRTGEEAYILKEHIKVIYADDRETLTPLSSYGRDKTDYRITDPLPPEYPFWSAGKYRSVLSYNIGPIRKENYPYPAFIVNEEFNTRKGVSLTLLKGVEFDPYDRFFYGLNFQASKANSNFILTNGSIYTEDFMHLSVGPYFSYDAFRLSRITITIAGGLTANYNNIAINASNQFFGNEERAFKAWSFTPRMNSHIAWTDVYLKTDVLLGAELQAELPYSLKSTDTTTNSNLWNIDNDAYSYELGATFSIYLGLQTKI
jgi:hypothetical protein